MDWLKAISKLNNSESVNERKHLNNGQFKNPHAIADYAFGKRDKRSHNEEDRNQVERDNALKLWMKQQTQYLEYIPSFEYLPFR